MESLAQRSAQGVLGVPAMDAHLDLRAELAIFGTATSVRAGEFWKKKGSRLTLHRHSLWKQGKVHIRERERDDRRETALLAARLAREFVAARSKRAI